MKYRITKKYDPHYDKFWYAIEIKILFIWSYESGSWSEKEIREILKRTIKGKKNKEVIYES